LKKAIISITEEEEQKEIDEEIGERKESPQVGNYATG